MSENVRWKKYLSRARDRLPIPQFVYMLSNWDRVVRAHEVGYLGAKSTRELGSLGVKSRVQGKRRVSVQSAWGGEEIEDRLTMTSSMSRNRSMRPVAERTD